MKTPPVGQGGQVAGVQDQVYQVCLISINISSHSPSTETSPIRSHKNLDITSRVETIKLVNQFQHGSLHLVIASSTVVKPRPTNGVNFIEENNARLLAPRHLE
jgi:hypothetical protein